MNDFEIENGVLRAYTGPVVDELVLPEGIVSIQENMGWIYYGDISSCRKIVFPTTLKEIGDNAFEESLFEEVVFLGDIELIGKKAFSSSKVEKIIFNGTVGTIDKKAFESCGLIKLEILNDVKMISNHAFMSSCLQEINIPSIKCIGNSAFSLCEFLEKVNIDTKCKMGKKVFIGCNTLANKQNQIVVNQRLYSNRSSSISEGDYTPWTSIPDDITSMDEDIIKPLDRFTIPRTLTTLPKQTVFDKVVKSNSPCLLPRNFVIRREKLFGKGFSQMIQRELFEEGFLMRIERIYLKLVQTGSEFKDIDFDKRFEEKADATLKAMFNILEDLDNEGSYMTAIKFAITNKLYVQDESISMLYKMVLSNQYKQCINLMNNEFSSFTLGLDDEQNVDVENIPYDKFSEKFKEEDMDRYLTRNKVNMNVFNNVKLKKSDKIAEPYLVKLAIVPYMLQESKVKIENAYTVHPYKKYSKESLSEKAIRYLDLESLQTNLKLIYENMEDYWLAAYCRYGSNDQIRRIIDDYQKSLINTKKKDQDSIKLISLEGALALSDATFARYYLAKKNVIDKFFKINTYCDREDYDDITHRGLTNHFIKEFTLPNINLIVRMNEDYSVSTYNKDTDEIVTDIPMNWRNKKQVTAVLEEIKIIKEEINESLTTIIDDLMKLFLSGEEIKPDDWKSKYLNYFINNDFAKKIVWTQGYNTFFLTEDNKFVDENGKDYKLKISYGIKVGHPAFISLQRREACINYLKKNKIKQPFIQMGEHVYERSAINSHRYLGHCVYRYMINEQKRNDIRIYKKSIECSPNKGEYDKDDILYYRKSEVNNSNVQLGEVNELEEFEFHYSNYRKTNHFIYVMDKMILPYKIINDELSLKNDLHGLTTNEVELLIGLAKRYNKDKYIRELKEYSDNNALSDDPVFIKCFTEKMFR